MSISKASFAPWCSQTSPADFTSFLQLSHWFLLKEGTTKIFGFPQPQRTQGHHWTHRISQGWVWSSFSCLHCNTWLLSWGKDWNIWSQLPLSSCNQYFPFQIQSICTAWQLSWLPLFSWGTQPHADAIYTLGKLFLQPYFPEEPGLVSHPKGESRDLWLWKTPWHFLKSKIQSPGEVSALVIAFCGPVVALF